RRRARTAGQRARFERDTILGHVAAEAGLAVEQVDVALFADLKDENRLIAFDDLSARSLIDRYNVALVQAVLLRAVSVRVEVRGESPARYRRLFHMLKFHRLLHHVEGSMESGYRIYIDGPLSLFSSTTKYGLAMALFFPVLLLCRDIRLEAELRWGPK